MKVQRRNGFSQRSWTPEHWRSVLVVLEHWMAVPAVSGRIVRPGPPTATTTNTDADTVSTFAYGSEYTVFHRNEVNDTHDLCCPSWLSCFLGTIIPCGWLCACRTVEVNEDLVMMHFGDFKGVLRKPGLYLVNPYGFDVKSVPIAVQSLDLPLLKVIDLKGSPLLVSGVVTYQITDSKRASLDVNNWRSLISTQSEVALKQVCSAHPYDTRDGSPSLKSATGKVREDIMALLQQKVNVAGLRILSFDFKEISYAPEIAAAMLVRQQAEALLDAREVVVQGSVRIAYDAMAQMKRAGLDLGDEETKRMCSNLILVITSESRLQPTLNFSSK